MLEQKELLPSIALLEKISSFTGIPVEVFLQEDGIIYTPSGRRITSQEAVQRAEFIVQEAGFSSHSLPPALWEFLCRTEAFYLKVTPEEVRILKSLKFKKGSGFPTPEDYQDFLVRVLRPLIPP